MSLCLLQQNLQLACKEVKKQISETNYLRSHTAFRFADEQRTLC